MTNKTIDNEQGHWILAKMGKRVLRPGGKDLTQRLIRNLGINNNDDVVEFAPGLGFTAAMALKANPKSYTGIELNDEVSGRLMKFIKGPGRRIVNANAANSTLMANSRSKVYGEAMLTMQADHRKSEIINEAHRILKQGGLYGIHELGLQPDTISEAEKAEIL
ncbi:MAG: class I SAM-dependent methyltransferase [Bacteroidetes bacterium]|nr:class I SAM-dependent methyltransferase [Bacteroidota bacterium]